MLYNIIREGYEQDYKDAQDANDLMLCFTKDEYKAVMNKRNSILKDASKHSVMTVQESYDALVIALNSRGHICS